MRLKWLWWILGIAAFLVFLYVTALPGNFAVGRDDDGLAGTYTVNGIDPTGVEYSGTAVIVGSDDPRSFDVEWIITNAIQQGSGSLDGSIFTVDWVATSAAAPGSGRTVYTVESDGRLAGVRTVDGFDQSGTEQLFPDP